MQPPASRAGARLAHAPLSEVRLAVRVSAGDPTTDDALGQLGRALEEVLRGTTMRVVPQFPGVPVLDDSPRRLRLLLVSREDGVRVNATASRLLVTQLGTQYPGWSVFRRLLTDVADAYLTSLNVTEALQATLSYQNAFEFEGPIDLSDHFSLFPALHPRLGMDTFGGFLVRVVAPRNAGSISLELAGAEAERPKKLQPKLTIEFATDDESETPPELFSNWLDEAHAAIEDCFLAALTEEALADIRGGAT